MNRSIRKYSLAACLLWALCAQGQPLTLTVIFSGITNTNALLGVLLFDQAAGFPNDPNSALQQTFIPASTAKVVFKNLQSGTYAVSVFQDLNGNHACDTNWMGTPVEPYGISGYKTPARFLPRFERASFQLNDQNITLTVPIHR